MGREKFSADFSLCSGFILSCSSDVLERWQFFSLFCILTIGQLVPYLQASLHLHPQYEPFCRYHKQVNRRSRHSDCGDLSILSRGYEYLMGIVTFVLVAGAGMVPICLRAPDEIAYSTKHSAEGFKSLVSCWRQEVKAVLVQKETFLNTG